MSSLGEPGLCLAPRKTYSERNQITVPQGAVLLFGVLEQRSEIDEEWFALFGEENTYEILSSDNLQLVRIPKFRADELSLRNQGNLLEFINHLNASTIFLDITGLPHHVWMPLTKVCIFAKLEVNCIYVEPKSYTYNPTPKAGEFFDLSERIQGFYPVPTFARLGRRLSEDSMLVPLLGFEGIRFRHLVERIEPNERNITPVIGVPGFELEYPFHTIEGNAAVLSNTRSWQRVNYVDASCPFSLYSYLTELRRDAPGQYLQIATIGTKPHALGAMMFAIKDQEVELLYDHPIRRRGRTTGFARCHLYYVSMFLENI